MKSENEFPKTSEVAWAVGKVTFLEIIRDKILYNILVCAFFVLGVAILASYLSFISPLRVIIDLGLMAVTLSCCGIGVLTGAGLLAKEFNTRTIYVALSYPISRGQFLLGKFLGLIAVVGLNWLLLSLVYIGILLVMSGNGAHPLSGVLFVALLFGLIQSIIVSAIAILFSTFSTTSVTVMITLGLFMLGHNISQIRALASRLNSTMSSSLLNFIASLLPNLEFYDLGTKVTYGLPISFPLFMMCVLYGIFVIGSLLLLSTFLIRNREA